MKMNKLLLLCLFFIIQINSLSTVLQEILHVDAEYPKVCSLKDGNIIALSSGVRETKISKLTKDGMPIFSNATMAIDYTADAQLVKPTKSDFYLLAHHGKSDSKETILTFKEQSTILNKVNRKNFLYQKSSVISLKNGNVLLAGINYSSKDAKGEKKSLDINIYNPATKTIGNGLSIDAYSNYISCYELKENDVYCVYVSMDTEFASKLKIVKILVNGNSLSAKGDQVIKVFYTEFNFLKAIAYNETESVVLFQTGNGQKGLGNAGGNLFYYQLELATQPFLVSVKRYEFLYPYCFYDKRLIIPNMQMLILLFFLLIEYMLHARPVSTDLEASLFIPLYQKKLISMNLISIIFML